MLVLLQRDDDAIAREHRRSGDDRGRRDAVDPDERAEADRQLADQVIDRRLADVIRLAAGLGHDRVRRAGEDHRGRQVLRLQHPRRFFRQHVVAGDVDVQRLGPDRLPRSRRQDPAWDRSPQC